MRFSASRPKNLLKLLKASDGVENVIGWRVFPAEVHSAHAPSVTLGKYQPGSLAYVF